MAESTTKCSGESDPPEFPPQKKPPPARTNIRPESVLVLLFRYKIVKKHSSGHRYETISKALSVPVRPVVSMIVRLKKFGNTRTPLTELAIC